LALFFREDDYILLSRTAGPGVTLAALSLRDVAPPRHPPQGDVPGFESSQSGPWVRFHRFRRSPIPVARYLGGCSCILFEYTGRSSFPL